MPRVIALQTLQSVFHLPLPLAAAELETSVSGLCNIMRAHGIERWPCPTEHINKRNARLVEALRAAVRAKNRALAREALVAFEIMPASKVAALLRMSVARFRKFHQGLGVAMWPYRPKRRQPYALKMPDDKKSGGQCHEGSRGAKAEASRTFIDSSESSDDAEGAAPRDFIDSSESSDDVEKETLSGCVGGSKDVIDTEVKNMNAGVGGSNGVDDTKTKNMNANVGGSKGVDDATAKNMNRSFGGSKGVDNAFGKKMSAPVEGGKKKHKAKAPAGQSNNNADDADSNAMLVYDDSGLPLEDAVWRADLIPPDFFCGDEQARMQDMMEYYEIFGCLPDLHSDI